jgi:hypothetical protein
VCNCELDSCTRNRKLVTDMTTVRDSCQAAGNLVVHLDPIAINKTHIEQCETVVAR